MSATTGTYMSLKPMMKESTANKKGAPSKWGVDKWKKDWKKEGFQRLKKYIGTPKKD